MIRGSETRDETANKNKQPNSPFSFQVFRGMQVELGGECRSGKCDARDASVIELPSDQMYRLITDRVEHRLGGAQATSVRDWSSKGTSRGSGCLGLRSISDSDFG